MSKSFNFKPSRQPFSVTANSLAITTAPITSSTPLLTYNAAKAIESVPYNNVAASANSILLTAQSK
jgi:hypothetical protein